MALVHGVSVIEDEMIRTFILWMFGMIIVQSLCLRRGFLQRCTMVIFILGASVVPFIAFSDQGVYRAGINVAVSGNLTNANGLAGWFGFCVVSLAISALETTRGIAMRIFYGLAAVGSLLIVGLTVSRGAMLGCALALTVAFRRFLKRAFVPALLLIIFAGALVMSGLFDRSISNYEERGMEETGRLIMWPLIIERILESPIVGFGNNIMTFIPDQRDPIPPHNSFLFFALSTGIVPFAFYVAFWVRAGWRSFSHMDQSKFAPFRLPFLLYLFVGCMLGDISTTLYVLLLFSVGAGSGVPHHRERGHVAYTRMPRRGIVPIIQFSSKAGTIRQ
jgi:O-antigen ligase